MNCEIWTNASLPRVNLEWKMCIYNPRKDKYISSYILNQGCWECDGMSSMIEQMKKYKAVHLIDIGSNIGFHTLAAASAGISVDAFEPVSMNVNMLRASLERNNLLRYVTVYSMCVGNHVQMASLAETRDNNIGGVRHLNNKEDVFQKVGAMKLDNILMPYAEPTFIKIDIEGDDCDALEGMKRFIDRTPIIGVAFEFQRLTRCCLRMMRPGGVLHVLHTKHKLCPQRTPILNVCDTDEWDVYWFKCNADYFKIDPSASWTHT